MRQFLQFAAIGALAFLVDAAVFLLLASIELNPFLARAASFLCAATFTWALNRRLTFANADTARPLEQWMRFLGANSLGACVNYATFATLIVFVDTARSTPLLALAAGSIAGLSFNFATSKHWVFRR